MRRTIKRFVSLLAVATVGVVGLVSSPAQAAWSDCGNYPGTVCLFANNNWGGPVWRQFPSQITGCRALTGFDNVTTMASNNTSGHYVLVLWQYTNCTGASVDINPQQYQDFTGYSFNDKASAVQVIAL